MDVSTESHLPRVATGAPNTGSPGMEPLGIEPPQVRPRGLSTATLDVFARAVEGKDLGWSGLRLTTGGRAKSDQLHMQLGVWRLRFAPGSDLVATSVLLVPNPWSYDPENMEGRIVSA